MKPLRAVDLRHRITIRRATETRNAKAGFTTAWADAGSAFAEVTSLNGQESVRERVLQGTSFYRIRIRWRDDIRESDQLRSIGECFRDRDVNIRSIVDPDGLREQLVILADTASTRSS